MTVIENNVRLDARKPLAIEDYLNAEDALRVKQAEEYEEATGGYLGYGDTETERAADAAFQMFLDEVDMLDWSLVGVRVGSDEMAVAHDEDVVKSRGALVGLMLHHGWLPPAPSIGMEVASVERVGFGMGANEAERPEWGDVMRWQLAKKLRNATTGDHVDESEPAPFWLGMADLASAGAPASGSLAAASEGR